jgi:hypothetical protein
MNNQLDFNLSSTLDFNQMLDKCWAAALGVTVRAKLYQASSPKDLSFIHCIFRGNEEYDTIMVNCTRGGKTQIITIDSPYMDDCVIHPPIKITQVESEQYLNAAGYDKWSVVLLREPLYSVQYPPLYIYTVPDVGYMAVDSTNGNVFQLF